MTDEPSAGPVAAVAPRQPEGESRGAWPRFSGWARAMMAACDRVSQNGTTGSIRSIVGYAAIWRPQRRATCERSRS